MGSEQSKINDEERKERNTLKTIKINENLEKIHNIEKNIIKSSILNNMSVVDTEKMKQYLQITTTATEQLKRDGKQFTKKDLIAILIALSPERIHHLHELDNMNVSDLIVMIRCIIYDPLRYINTSNSNYQQLSKNQNENIITGTIVIAADTPKYDLWHS